MLLNEKGAVCGSLVCKFGGHEVVDPVKGCICSCLDNFYGPDCSSFNTTVLPTLFDPVECNDLPCDALGPDSEIAGYCPVKCICKYLFSINLLIQLKNLFT